MKCNTFSNLELELWITNSEFHERVSGQFGGWFTKAEKITKLLHCNKVASLLQRVSDLQTFFFFYFMMEWKWYAFRRNCDSDFEFWSFSRPSPLWWCWQGSKLQLPVHPTITRVNNDMPRTTLYPDGHSVLHFGTVATDDLSCSTLCYKISLVLDDFAQF